MPTGQLIIYGAELVVSLLVIGGSFGIWRRRKKNQDNSLDNMRKELDILTNELQVKVTGGDDIIAVGEIVTVGELISRLLNQVRALALSPNVDETDDSEELALSIKEDLRKDRADAFTEFRRHIEKFVRENQTELAQKITREIVKTVSQDAEIIGKLKNAIETDLTLDIGVGSFYDKVITMVDQHLDLKKLNESKQDRRHGFDAPTELESRKSQIQDNLAATQQPRNINEII